MSERLREAAVAICRLWFTDNAPDGSQHLRKAMLDLRDALDAFPATPAASAERGDVTIRDALAFDAGVKMGRAESAGALDVERLARAMNNTPGRLMRDYAWRVAREYARLAADPTP